MLCNFNPFIENRAIILLMYINLRKQRIKDCSCNFLRQVMLGLEEGGGGGGGDLTACNVF